MNLGEIFDKIINPREAQAKTLVLFDTTGFECEVIPAGAYVNLKPFIIECNGETYQKLQEEQQIGQLRLETSISRIGDECAWSFVVRAAHQLDNNANARIYSITTWWIKTLRDAIRLHDVVAKQQVDVFTQAGFVKLKPQE